MSRERRALGKGLDALIPTAGQDVRELPVEAIRPNPYQPRRNVDEANLDELAASIAAHGVVQPVIVVPEGDGYVLVAGERRWRAAMRAGLQRIPAVVRDLDPVAMTEIALIENLQRQDLTAIEEAHAYRLLQEEFGLTQEEIARRVGKSRPHVANTLRLLQLAPEVQQAVAAGLLSAGHARLLVTLPAEQQRRLAGEVMERGLPVRDLERRLQATRTTAPRRRPRARPATRDANLASLEEQLRRRLGSPVSIQIQEGGRGRLVIDFFSAEDLERLLELLLPKP